MTCAFFFGKCGSAIPGNFKPFAFSIYHSLIKKQVSRFIHSIKEEDLLNHSFSSLLMPLMLYGEQKTA